MSSKILLFAILLSLPSWAVGQVIFDEFQFITGDFSTIPMDCDGNGGVFGIDGGRFVISDMEGIPCCTSGALMSGGNGNIANSRIINLSLHCDISIVVEVSLEEDADGLDCDLPNLPLIGTCGAIANDPGRDALQIDVIIDGVSTTIGSYCGNMASGSFRIDNVNSTTGVAFIIITGGTQDPAEAYIIERIYAEGMINAVGGTASITPSSTTLCDGMDPFILTGRGGDPSSSTYTWSQNGTVLPGQNDLILSLGVAQPSLAGTYELTISDPNFCIPITVTSEVMVISCTGPSLDFTGLNTRFCRTTDQFSLPSTDNNGITGTWNVPVDLVLNTVPSFNEIIFTPDPSSGIPDTIIAIQLDEITPFGNFPFNGIDTCLSNVAGGQTLDLVEIFDLDPTVIDAVNFNGVNLFFESEWRAADAPANDGSFSLDVTSLPFGTCGRDNQVSSLNITFIDQLTTVSQNLCQGQAPNVDFRALIQNGNPDIQFADINGIGVDISNPSSVDLSGLPAGNYTWQFSLSPLGCNASSQADLNITIDPVTPTFLSPPLCEGDPPFLFNGEFYSQDTQVTVLVPNATMLCDDLVMLDIVFEPLPGRVINPPALCAGEVFTYNGVDYTTDQDTVVTVTGIPCDSMNELILTFLPAESISIMIDTLCEGASFDFRGMTYTQSEVVSLTFPGMNGACDTTATLDLVFNTVPSRTLSRTDLCLGETFTFDGVDYTSDINTTVSIDNPAGACDSLITLDLAFRPVPMRTVVEVLCQGELFSFDGVDYTSDTIVSVTTANPGGPCDSLIMLDLSFMALPTMPVVETLCEGDTFSFDNMTYTEDIVVDVRVPDANGGCDTIFNLDLTFSPLVRTTIAPDLCEGDNFSFTANGNTYAEGQLLSGTERVPGPNGCDSVITIDLFFKPNSETLFEEIRQSGDGFSQVINGVTFDESNPTDTITLPSANGCDSTILVNFIFVQGVFDSLIVDDQCIGSGFSVAGGPNGPYDEANPSGIDTFMLADGRDSFFITRINFQDPAINRFTNTLTTGDSFSIDFNGVTYDASNPMGRDTLPGAAANGCDSIIIVSLTFTDAFTTVIDSMLCQGDPFSVQVDGITFDEDNPVGMDTLVNADGIDSIVTVDLDFRAPDTTMIMTPRCIGDGFSLTVGPDTYDEANPSGITPLTNAIGCDSIVIVDLQFTNGVTSTRTDTLCSGTTVMIGNTVYGENTQLSGTEVLTAAAGCDSTIIVDLTVDTVHFELTTEPICPDATEFEFTIINTRPGQMLMALIDGVDRMVIDTLRESLPIGAQDIILTSESSCGVMSPFDLMMLPPQTLDIVSTPAGDDTLSLSLDFSGIVSSTIWTQGDTTELCVDCTSVNVSSLDPATYEVEVVDELGCTFTASFEVEGDGDDPPPPPPPLPPVAQDTMDFFLPNVISASNANPLNASLFLQTANPSIIDYDLRIYNRWGNLVRNLGNLIPNDPNFGWDGRSNSGELQPSGVYVYVVVIRREGSAEQTLAGDILLMQ